MTNYAIISDVHGNQVALEEVLKHIDAQEPKIDKILSLGDIIGYGAKSSECISIFKERDIISIAGNHDYTASRPEEMDKYDEDSKKFFADAAKNLSVEDLDYLRSLPLTLNLPEFTLVHASPVNPEIFQYIRGRDDVLNLAFSKLFEIEEINKSPCGKIFFIGHTHSPCYYSLRKNILKHNRDDVISDHASENLMLQLDENSHHLINSGSVGQPRDRDNRSCYIVFNSVKRTVKYHRVSYDIEKVQKQILRAGINIQFAQRLQYGY